MAGTPASDKTLGIVSTNPGDRGLPSPFVDSTGKYTTVALTAGGELHVSATITLVATQDVNITQVGGNVVTTTVPVSGTVAVTNDGLTELAGAINASAQVDVNIAASGATVPVSNAGLTELAAAINSNKVDVNIVSSDVSSGGTSAAAGAVGIGSKLKNAYTGLVEGKAALSAANATGNAAKVAAAGEEITAANAIIKSGMTDFTAKLGIIY